MADKNLWLRHVDKNYAHSFPSGKLVPEIIEAHMFKLKGPEGDFEFDWDLAKEILKIDSYRQSISYTALGSHERDIYPGGLSLLRENLFKARATITYLNRIYGSKGRTTLSQMSFISNCRTVGKPKPGKNFSVGIPAADYLLAVDGSITADMLAELSDEQRQIAKLNKNLSDEVRLLLELE
jgi:hypothetical protein